MRVLTTQVNISLFPTIETGVEREERARNEIVDDTVVAFSVQHLIRLLHPIKHSTYIRRPRRFRTAKEKSFIQNAHPFIWHIRTHIRRKFPNASTCLEDFSIWHIKNHTFFPEDVVFFLPKDVSIIKDTPFVNVGFNPRQRHFIETSHLTASTT